MVATGVRPTIYYMKTEILNLGQLALTEISDAKDSAKLEEIEIKYLGRKDGALNNILKSLKDLATDDRKASGERANQVKNEIMEALAKKRIFFDKQSVMNAIEDSDFDGSLPGTKQKIGSLSPLTQVQMELEDLFRSLGFMVLDGPELESDYYNFEALNIPEHHPARDMQDTFYIKGRKQDKEKMVLRTHTSPMQVRAMQKYGAPLRAVVPGRVFRNEAVDASHDNTFDQLEGMMIGEKISITNLIAVMKTLLKAVFKKEVKIRLRPGFFPFVEPGFELDINCLICGGKGCSVCKHSGWVELLPCGMIHPSVLRAGNIDPEKYSGFAFGVGLTRLVMMKHGIDNIRLINSGDVRFAKEF